jgi:hypothetical protein
MILFHEYTCIITNEKYFSVYSNINTQLLLDISLDIIRFNNPIDDSHKQYKNRDSTGELTPKIGGVS